MDKSSLFHKAHALTKKVRQAGDCYRATFGLCLIFLSSMVQDTTTMSDKVLLATFHKFSEEHGAYELCYTYDAKLDAVESHCSIGDNKGYDSFVKSLPVATAEQKQSAVRCWELNHTRSLPSESNWRDILGTTVTLSRSRKAPNKVSVKIIDFQSAYFDERYGNRVSAQVLVEWEGGKAWTAYSAVASVVCNKLPEWACS